MTTPTPAALRAAEAVLKRLKFTNEHVYGTDTAPELARIIDAAGMAEAVEVLKRVQDACAYTTSEDVTSQLDFLMPQLKALLAKLAK